MLNKSLVKKLLLWLSILALVLLSGCDIHSFNQEKMYEADITEFYNSNHNLLNKAVEEYKANTDGKIINIFYIENLILNEIPGLADETSEIVVWEPEAKINHTEQISEYENCVKVLNMMNDYMSGHGFEQINKDYSVSVSSRVLDIDQSVHNTDDAYVIEFEFNDDECRVSYSLYYSETELAEEFTKIDANWYVDVWYRV